MTIWKYQVWRHRNDNGDEIEMPQGAKVIHVGIQGSHIHLWALAEQAMPLVKRRFVVRGTGWEVERDGLHVGTVQGAGFVWHVFELPSSPSPAQSGPECDPFEVLATAAKCLDASHKLSSVNCTNEP